MTIITDYEALIAFLTLFLCWIFQQVLERPLGLHRTLHTVSSIENIGLRLKATATNLNSSRMINENKIDDDHTVKPLEDLLALEAYHDASGASTSRTPPHIPSPSFSAFRLTHSVDEAGVFRMQVQSSTHFLKGVWNIIMLFFSGFVAFDSSFYYDHFIKFDKKSVDYLPYRCISASILVFHAWEMILEKFRIRFEWSLAVHHWLISLFALAILQGFYLPSVTWYGFTSVQLAFPLWFTLGFRGVFSMKSKKYAKITRIIAKFCYHWYIIVTLSNASGQFYIFLSRLIYGKLNIFEVIVLPVAVMAWMYHDFSLLRAIHGISEQEYEHIFLRPLLYWDIILLEYHRLFFDK